MENASKALLIAGGVLIAILVASLGVYFSRTMADDVAEFYKMLEESKKTEFNQQFLVYNENKVNIQDILTIVNLAKDSNKKNDFGSPDDGNLNGTPSNPLNDNSMYITVNFDNVYEIGEITSTAHKKNLEKLKNDQLNNAIKKEMSKPDEVQEFDCEVKINNNTGYVNYIRIY